MKRLASMTARTAFDRFIGRRADDSRPAGRSETYVMEQNTPSITYEARLSSGNRFRKHWRSTRSRTSPILPMRSSTKSASW